jgi:hypothetical protein
MAKRIVESSTFTNIIVKSKVSGDTLQAGVYQKGTTTAVPVTTSTVLASIALDLKAGIPVNTTIAFTAVAGRISFCREPREGRRDGRDREDNR